MYHPTGQSWLSVSDMVGKILPSSGSLMLTTGRVWRTSCHGDCSVGWFSAAIMKDSTTLINFLSPLSRNRLVLFGIHLELQTHKIPQSLLERILSDRRWFYLDHPAANGSVTTTFWPAILQRSISSCMISIRTLLLKSSLNRSKVASFPSLQEINWSH